jgi:cyclophilin family peptidyl-prolyl cis-trans isomerase
MEAPGKLLISITMRRLLILASISIALSPIAQAAPAASPAAPATENGAPVRSREYLSPVYTVDKIYKSMEGPYQQEPITLEPNAKPELLWVKSVRVDIVGEDGKTPAPSEFMCHMNLDLDSAKHQQLLALPYAPAARIVTLSQGVFDARLPAGYGFPIVSSEPLVVFTQVLNHNIQQPNNRKVRHRVTIEYLRDAEVTTAVKPLANMGASGTVLEQPAKDLFKTMDDMPGMDHSAGGASSLVIASTAASSAASSTSDAPKAPEGIHHDGGLTCLIGTRAPNSRGGDYVDPDGHKVVGHWVVPPGRQVNRSDVTWFMNLPYDTKMHFALAHLHPFATSLTLRDTTTGQELWKAVAKNPKDSIGLTHVDAFESKEGIPMYHDHKYELISVYDNPTKVNADSMASMFMGIDDPQFRRPSQADLATRYSELIDNHYTTVVIRTSAGDVAADLDREKSPQAVKQFVRLLRAGVFEHAAFDRVDPERGLMASTGPLTKEQHSLLYAMLEQAAPHHTGSLSWCPATDASFSIVLSNRAPLNGRCTAFGSLGPGAAVIRAINESPRGENGKLMTPVSIKSIELIDATALASVVLAPPPATPMATLQ